MTSRPLLTRPPRHIIIYTSHKQSLRPHNDVHKPTLDRPNWWGHNEYELHPEGRDEVVCCSPMFHFHLADMGAYQKNFNEAHRHTDQCSSTLTTTASWTNGIEVTFRLVWAGTTNMEAESTPLILTGRGNCCAVLLQSHEAPGVGYAYDAGQDNIFMQVLITRYAPCR